jgi:hypothetical protein
MDMAFSSVAVPFFISGFFWSNVSTKQWTSCWCFWWHLMKIIAIWFNLRHGWSSSQSNWFIPSGRNADQLCIILCGTYTSDLMTDGSIPLSKRVDVHSKDPNRGNEIVFGLLIQEWTGGTVVLQWDARRVLGTCVRQIRSPAEPTLAIRIDKKHGPIEAQKHKNKTSIPKRGHWHSPVISTTMIASRILLLFVASALSSGAVLPLQQAVVNEEDTSSRQLLDSSVVGAFFPNTTPPSDSRKI